VNIRFPGMAFMIQRIHQYAYYHIHVSLNNQNCHVDFISKTSSSQFNL